MNQITKEILAYGNCDFVRDRGKAALGKDMSPRTGTWYKADGTVSWHNTAKPMLIAGGKPRSRMAGGVRVEEVNAPDYPIRLVLVFLSFRGK